MASRRAIVSGLSRLVRYANSGAAPASIQVTESTTATRACLPAVFQSGRGFAAEPASAAASAQTGKVTQVRRDVLVMTPPRYSPLLENIHVWVADHYFKTKICSFVMVFCHSKTTPVDVHQRGIADDCDAVLHQTWGIWVWEVHMILHMIVEAIHDTHWSVGWDVGDGWGRHRTLLIAGISLPCCECESLIGFFYVRVGHRCCR